MNTGSGSRLANYHHIPGGKKGLGKVALLSRGKWADLGPSLPECTRKENTCPQGEYSALTQ